MIESPGRSPERILVFGIEGTGKTRGFLSIVRATPNVTHWVVDNDNGIDRLLETEFADLKVREEYKIIDGVFVPDDSYTDPNGTMVLIHAHGWEANSAAFEYVVGHAQRGDWWLVDNASNVWVDVQSWYVEAVHGLEMDDFLLEYRIAAKKQEMKDADKKAPGGTEAMFVEWNFVNPVYKKRVQQHLMNPPCHLYVTAMQTDLNPRDKDKTTADIYGGVSVKATGQKGLGPNAQTVLWVKKYATAPYWRYKTLKDRGRDEWNGVGVDDFAMDYLEGVAGWHVSDVDVTTNKTGQNGARTTTTSLKKVAKNFG